MPIGTPVRNEMRRGIVTGYADQLHDVRLLESCEGGTPERWVPMKGRTVRLRSDEITLDSLDEPDLQKFSKMLPAPITPVPPLE